MGQYPVSFVDGVYRHGAVRGRQPGRSKSLAQNVAHHTALHQADHRRHAHYGRGRNAERGFGYDSSTYEYADVIGTYLYRYGLVGGNFSYGTAVGLFISLINFGLMFLANKVSRRVADYSLW